MSLAMIVSHALKHVILACTVYSLLVSIYSQASVLRDIVLAFLFLSTSSGSE